MKIVIIEVIRLMLFYFHIWVYN